MTESLISSILKVLRLKMINDFKNFKFLEINNKEGIVYV